jgi:hypothetical protein
MRSIMFVDWGKPSPLQAIGQSSLPRADPSALELAPPPNRGTRQESPRISLPTSVFHKTVLREKSCCQLEPEAHAAGRRQRAIRVNRVWLLLAATFSDDWGALAIKLGLRLDQYDLTGLHIAQLFARFFFDGTGVFPL